MNNIYIALTILTLCAFLAVKHWLSRSPSSIVFRYGINTANLYVVDNPTFSAVQSPVYECRIRKLSKLYRMINKLELPAEIIECRRVSTVPGKDYPEVVSAWESNTVVIEVDGVNHIDLRLMLRPMTPQERKEEWPKALENTFARQTVRVQKGFA